MPAKSLSLFTDFQCQSCTRCCSSPWMVTLNSDDYKIIETIIAMKYGKSKVKKYITAANLPDQPHIVGTVNKRKHNKCVFLNDRTKLCDLQTEFGHDVLPLGCKTFPRYRVKVGDENFYSFSAICPTVKRHYKREEAIGISNLPEKYNDQYPGAASNCEVQTLSLQNRKMTAEAYFELQKYFVECCSDFEFSHADAVLSYIGKTMHKVFSSHDDALFDQTQAQAFIANEMNVGKKEFFLSQQSLKINFAHHLALLQSWLVLRASEGGVEPEILHTLIKKYSQQPTVDDANLYSKNSHDRIIPLMQEHPWVFRNYLASKISYDPHVIAEDCFSFFFFYTVLAISLFKMVLLEMLEEKDELNGDDILSAIEAVDMNTMHARVLEKKLVQMVKQQKISPQDLL